MYCQPIKCPSIASCETPAIITGHVASGRYTEPGPKGYGVEYLTSKRPVICQDQGHHDDSRHQSSNTCTPGLNYQFRYDEGLSAKLGGRICPLMLTNGGKLPAKSFKNNDFVFKQRISDTTGLPGASRILPEQPIPWWPPAVEPCTLRKCPVGVQAPPKPKTLTRRYKGYFTDLGANPPTGTVISHF